VITLTGILRGLQLDKDWIEVSINGENIKIYDAKEEIDDVIGRMVNRRIVVEVLDKSEKAADKRYTLLDIQLEEDLV
jgi:acyl carrier protein phosphodiesterase